MFLRLMGWLVLSTCCVALAACSSTSTVRLDGGAPADGAIAPTGTIVLETEGAIGLAPGGEATFRARWLGPDGQPVARGAVSFGLEGTPRDSTLRSLGGTTDDEGRVEGTLRAGTMPGAFRVRIAAPGASPAYVDVAVGAEGFGRILVEVRGGADRSVATRLTALHLDTTCADALSRPEADRMRELPMGETTTEFVALPAGQSFTVVARGESERGIVVASGCVESVRVTADASIRAVVELGPRPLQVGGEYATTVSIQPGSADTGAGATATATLVAALTTTVAAAGGDERLLLDTLEFDLRDRGHDVSADALALERLTGEPDATLRAALEASGTGPSRAIAGALEVIAPGLDAMAVEGTLAIAADPDGGALASFSRGYVRMTAATGERVDVGLGALGVEERRPATVRWSGADDTLAVDALSIALPLGTLTAAALDALARARGEDGAVTLLMEHGGCSELDAIVEARPDLRASCDAACVLDSCRGAIAGVLATTLEATTTLDDLRHDVLLSGALACEDGDGDLVVDAMSTISIAGAWTSADGTVSEPVSAAIETTRLAVLP